MHRVATYTKDRVGTRYMCIIRTLADPEKPEDIRAGQLPANYGGRELHGAALSPARGDPERKLEFPEAQPVH
jgi:hypothetical protein